MRSDLPPARERVQSECRICEGPLHASLLWRRTARSGIISMRDVIVLMLDEKQFLIDS